MPSKTATLAVRLPVVRRPTFSRHSRSLPLLPESPTEKVALFRQLFRGRETATSQHTGATIARDSLALRLRFHGPTLHERGPENPRVGGSIPSLGTNSAGF